MDMYCIRITQDMDSVKECFKFIVMAFVPCTILQSRNSIFKKKIWVVSLRRKVIIHFSSPFILYSVWSIIKVLVARCRTGPANAKQVFRGVFKLPSIGDGNVTNKCQVHLGDGPFLVNSGIQNYLDEK